MELASVDPMEIERSPDALVRDASAEVAPRTADDPLARSASGSRPSSSGCGRATEFDVIDGTRLVRGIANDLVARMLALLGE